MEDQVVTKIYNIISE